MIELQELLQVLSQYPEDAHVIFVSVLNDDSPDKSEERITVEWVNASGTAQLDVYSFSMSEGWHKHHYSLLSQ